MCPIFSELCNSTVMYFPYVLGGLQIGIVMKTIAIILCDLQVDVSCKLISNTFVRLQVSFSDHPP